MGKRGPDGLSDSQRAFLLEYQQNGRNATRAYLASHPACKSYQAARVQGSKVLANPRISALLAKLDERQWKAMQMSGDEAMALIGLSARADMLDAYEPDEDGKLQLLPIERWPRSLRLAVKAVKANGDIVLHDGLKARELVATAEGRIRSRVDIAHSFDHAGHLAALTPAAPAKELKP